MWQVSYELSIFSGRFGSDFYSCIYINDLWTSQSSNRPFSNCAVSSLSIQNQSVINEDYSDRDGVYNGVWKIQTLKDPGTIADTAAHYEKKFQDHSRLASFIVTSCL